MFPYSNAVGSQGHLGEQPPRVKGFAYLERLGATSKAEKLRAVFKVYLDGQPLREVMAARSCAPSVRLWRNCAASASHGYGPGGGASFAGSQ